MINCEKLFKRIDDMEQEYVKILEEFCLIESPTDYKEGVDVASKNIHLKDEYTLISSLTESAKALAAICCYI